MCMATNLTVKPIIPVAPSVTQQANAVNFKAELAQDSKAVQKGNLSPLEQLSRKTALEAKLQEAQATPVKYSEELKPVKKSGSISESSPVSSPIPDSTVKNIQNGKQYSLNERDMILVSQMNQLAASNRVLHGLF